GGADFWVGGGERISSSARPRTPRPSAQSPPNAARASIAASTATWPSHSRVRKLSGLISDCAASYFGRLRHSQPVAEASDRLDQRRARRAIDLLPQVAHVDVDEIVEHLRGFVPHALDQSRA